MPTDLTLLQSFPNLPAIVIFRSPIASFLKIAPTVIGVLLVAATLHAFPPAPYYVLFGTVRDQVGQTVVADNAEVLLTKNGTVLQRTPIASVVGGERNYELNIELDSARSDTTSYSEKAIAPNGEFGLVVEMNGERYYPIEVAGTLRAGRGGERIRLDLTLGRDLDGDGLPDIWEQWQLYQAGFYPDETGNWDLSLITASGDFDGDGQSNLKEYYAGTFAGDATETFDLAIKDIFPDNVLVEFFGVTNKYYWIEKSTDLVTWSPATFALGGAGSQLSSHVAPGSGIINASIPCAPGDKKTFYRLNVR
jgi:hypothetical protein